MTPTSTFTPTRLNTKPVRTGLIVAALLGTCAAAYATSHDNTGTPGKAVSKAERVVSDSWITTKVKSEILANSLSKGFKVHVTTKHGAVALEGKLPNNDAVELVKMIAEKVQGVKSVDVSGLVVGS